MTPDTDTDDTDIRAYGTDERRKPILHKDDVIRCRVPGKGEIPVGYRGPIPSRRQYGFVQFCTRKKHFHRNEAGYALSERVLRKVRTLGCQMILIAEEDTGLVYEFHERQFDTQVAKHNNPMHEEDPQYKVEIVQNRGKWHDHAPHVLLGDRGSH